VSDVRSVVAKQKHARLVTRELGPEQASLGSMWLAG